MDGSRSDPSRAGLGLDESEWEEPERLSSTPMPSPIGSTRGGGGGGKMTPMTVRGLVLLDVGCAGGVAGVLLLLLFLLGSAVVVESVSAWGLSV